MTPTIFATLNIEHPIIQAPMVGVSNPQLAAAVSNANGLGSIGLGASSAAQGRVLIQQTKALTDRPFNVNMFCHQPVQFDQRRNDAWLAYVARFFPPLDAVAPTSMREIYRSFLDDEEMLEMLLEEKPAVVSFHFGTPSAAWVDRLKEKGIYTLGCATTPAEAELIEQAGIQSVVAQGHEAGGHRGVFDDAPGQDHQIGLMALVRLIASTVSIPVIAAGGIMDGSGINAALALGACGVQMGTAFILCPESSASSEHRAVLKTGKSHETRITSYISGRPARGIPNSLYLEGLGEPVPLPAEYPLAYDVAKALHAAASSKDSQEFAAQWAGQGAPLARVMPAAQLIAQLVQEMGNAANNSEKSN
jgi:nitronate monooxygenase